MLALDLVNGAELRALEPWHAAEFLAHLDEARENLRPWVPMASRIFDVDAARTMLQTFADKQAADKGRIYGIWVDGNLAGGAMFRTFDAQQGVCELGVWLSPAAEGRGLINRAVTHMIQWAATSRGIVRFEWWVSPENERSRAAARRLGFKPEGILKSNFLLNGTRRDTEVWALIP